MSQTGAAAHAAQDLDQILADAEPASFQRLTHQDVDGDLPGLAQHYCVACSFVCAPHCRRRPAQPLLHRRQVAHGPHALEAAQAPVRARRRGSQPMRYRLKQLEMPALTTAELEAAGGLGAYVAPVKTGLPATLHDERQQLHVKVLDAEARRAEAVHAVPDL